MPAYNSARYIGASLESIFAQSYRPIEVIVVDDGSTDHTSQVIQSYPDVIYVHQENGGPSKARNHGIQIASGEYIAFLDADDLWPREKIDEQVSILEARPEIGLIFGDMRCFSEANDLQPTMFERYGLTREYFGHDQVILDPVSKLMTMNFVPTGTVLARRAALLEVGSFDEKLQLVEDWDLWLRTALRYPVAYSSQIWKLKRLHSMNLSNDAEAMAKAAICVLEKFKSARARDLLRCGANVNPHLRKAYRNLGYFYLQQLRLDEGRRELARSLACGFEPRALLYWICTFLSPGIVGALIRIRG